jgi:hypothetical protein
MIFVPAFPAFIDWYNVYCNIWFNASEAENMPKYAAHYFTPIPLNKKKGWGHSLETN